MSWQNSVSLLAESLNGLSFRNSQGQEMAADAAFELWRETTDLLRARQSTIYLIGNGASASMASHFAADLAKNGHLHTQVFSDLSLITAISNDISFAEVFAEPLRRRGRQGDMLVAISSSGRSPNILRAVEVAQTLEMTVVTLSSMDAVNPLRSLGFLNAYVQADTYGLAETGHAAILHHWMDQVEKWRVSS